MYNPNTGKQGYGNVVKRSVDIVLMSPAGEDIEK